MPRALWTGNISFGLVSIPVSLVPAEQVRDRLHFSLVDRRDHAPVGYQKINKTTGAVLDKGQIMKAYEYEKGEFVEIDEADLAKFKVPGSQNIEIETFVDLSKIDWLYFVRPYYVLPQKRGEKAYALLRAVLTDTQRVGVAKIVIQTRQHLAMVATRDDALIVELLRFGHELRSPKEFSFPTTKNLTTKITESEVKMGARLIEEMTSDWKPQKYTDTYYEDVMALIEKKAHSHKRTYTRANSASPTRASKVLDLMPLLRKSLERAEQVKPTAARKIRSLHPRRHRSA